MSANRASIYLHVPFCAGRRCDYCDFFSLPVSANNADDSAIMDAFVDAALNDVKDQLDFFEVTEVPTVYVGGGTPSALGAARMERLLSGIGALLNSPSLRPEEFTVEANLESADAAFLRVCKDGGVNRISLGVQTFNGESRRLVGRGGGTGGRDSAQVSRRLALVAGMFPGAFSADLIAGLPLQTADVLAGDVKRLLEFGPAHVSLYGLVVEPETVLGSLVYGTGGKSGAGGKALCLPTDDEADALWIAGRDMLENAGLKQYEVSNFALPGKTCAHNIRYWRMESWIGAGPSASGTLIGESGTGRRFTYPRDVAGYVSAPRPLIAGYALVEELSADDLMRETLLMGFRYREGPDRRSFRKRFGRDPETLIPKTVARWRARGFFETGTAAGGNTGTLAPSREGLLFVNAFLRDAFAEMDAGDAGIARQGKA